MPVAALLRNAWQAQRHAALAGGGFALAIGWLWFEDLRALWLPEQTGNFAMLALTGFSAALCGTGLLLHFRRGAFFPVPFASLAHGAAMVVLLAAWLLQPWPWAFALLVGISGAGTGIFWLAHILRPTPCHTLNALVWAGGASLLLAWATTQLLCVSPFISSSPLWLLAALCSAMAWLLSFGLPNHSLSDHKETYNPAPPQGSTHGAQAHINKTGGLGTPIKLLIACGGIWGVAFFCLGLAFAKPLCSHLASIWGQGAAHFAGTLAAYALWRTLSLFCTLPNPHSSYMLPCVCGILGLAALPIVLPAFWPGMSFLAGLLETLGLAGIAFTFLEAQHKSPHLAFMQSAIALLTIVVAVNGGAMVGSVLSNAGKHVEIAEPLALLFGAMLLFVMGMHRHPNPAIQPAHNRPPEAPPAPRPFGPIVPAEIPKEIFTEKEQAIAVLMLQGFTNSAIAKNTGITENTVRWHIKNLYKKTGTANRRELAAKLSCGHEEA